MSSVPIALINPPRETPMEPVMPTRAPSTRGLDFVSYRPGVHRFVMPGFEVRTRVHCPSPHHYFGGNATRSSKRTNLFGDCDTTQVPPGRPRRLETGTPSIEPGAAVASASRCAGACSHGLRLLGRRPPRSAMSRWVIRSTSSIVVMPFGSP